MSFSKFWVWRQLLLPLKHRCPAVAAPWNCRISFWPLLGRKDCCTESVWLGSASGSPRTIQVVCSRPELTGGQAGKWPLGWHLPVLVRLRVLRQPDPPRGEAPGSPTSQALTSARSGRAVLAYECTGWTLNTRGKLEVGLCIWIVVSGT